MHKIFVLSGSSGTGKTTLLNGVVDKGLCHAAIKYSERKSLSCNDDITFVESIDDDYRCDITYSMYGNRYGFCLNEISNQLIQNNTILITNDANTIRLLKNRFLNRVVVILVISNSNRNIFRNIYLNRHGFPSIVPVQRELQSHLSEAEAYAMQDDLKNMMYQMGIVDGMVEQELVKDNEYLLRLRSVEDQYKIYLSGQFEYDYVVYNSFSKNISSPEAIQPALEKVEQIIKKETDYDE